MPVPTYQQLMLPVLRLIAGGAKNVGECIPQIRVDFNITDEEAGQLLPTGRSTVLNNRAHWARLFLAKAGLLESLGHNRHAVTERGRALLNNNPDHIDNEVLERYPDFEAWKHQIAQAQSNKPQEAIADSKTQTPEEAIEAAHKILNSALGTDLLAALDRLSPQRFERLILDLLIAMRYGGGELSSGSLTKATGDGGIDGIINQDALGLDAVYIQAKKYAPENKVSRPDLQRFVGALGGVTATKGVFVTTSDFSSEAREYVTRVTQRIILINGTTLAQLMIQHGVGVRVRTTYAIRSVDEDYFSDSAA